MHLLTPPDLSQGFVVIPKSTKQARIADNANVFDFTLDKEDLDVSRVPLTDVCADGVRAC